MAHGRLRRGYDRLLGSTVVRPLDACGLPPGNEAPVSNSCNRCALAKQQANKWRTLIKTSQAIANQARGWSQLKESLGTGPPGPRAPEEC